jgi:hypothetical protein
MHDNVLCVFLIMRRRIEVSTSSQDMFRITKAQCLALFCESPMNTTCCGTRFHDKPNNLTALPFKIPGITSGLKPATSKSFIQRSGVISG